MPKFIIEIDKNIKECEGQLAGIYQSYAPQSIFSSNYEARVMALLEKIKSLNKEKDRVVGRMGKLRNLITPWMDTFLSSQQDVMNSLNKSVLADLRGAEMHAYLFSILINILEILKKRWDDHLQSLKTIFVDIFKFL